MTYTITLIPGDGTGPEVTEATLRVLKHLDVDIEWDVQECGLAVMEEKGTPLPDEVIESLRRNGIGLKGPLTTPIGTGFRSVNVALRKTLDLYACVRPCKWYPGVRSKYEGLDLVIIRENTEDLYAGLEFEQGSEWIPLLSELLAKSGQNHLRPDAGVSLKVISEFGSRRILKYAFDYARQHGRRKVTAVTKANIMKFTDGLFLHVAREVAKDYPEIEYEERLVDNMFMQLVTNPESYDVLVLPNLYGDVASDIAAGLVGGLGVAPGANIGENGALFEAVHGSAPRYAGLNKVNPMAMMLSAMLMLRYLGETKPADMLETAIAEVIREGRHVTYDLKRDRNDPSAVGTSQVADAVIMKLDRILSSA